MNLKDKIKNAREIKAAEPSPKPAAPAAEKIIKRDKDKDKGFSCKCNTQLFEDFTAINRFFGQSNNSVINKLMREYVMQNKQVLENI